MKQKQSTSATKNSVQKCALLRFETSFLITEDTPHCSYVYGLLLNDFITRYIIIIRYISSWQSTYVETMCVAVLSLRYMLEFPRDRGSEFDTINQVIGYINKVNLQRPLALLFKFSERWNSRTQKYVLNK